MELSRFIENAYIKPVPDIQILIGKFFLHPIYKLKNLKIDIEGVEKIPEHPVIFAMNHTDRYNYWPFMYKLWRLHLEGKIKYPYITVWVKGKYFENRFIASFMRLSGTIPVPSKGYLVVKDFYKTYGSKVELTDEELVMLLDYVAGRKELEYIKALARREVYDFLTTPHGDFDPERYGSYRDYIEVVFTEMMKKVLELNRDAIFNKKLNLLVFPEGRRSKKLTRGKPGLAQVALALDVPVVPVGCNGSDKAYTGNLPFPKANKKIVYRVGEPIDFKKVSDEFDIKEDFVPFTPQTKKLQGVFNRATEIVMERIYNLLDEEYRGDFRDRDAAKVSTFI